VKYLAEGSRFRFASVRRSCTLVRAEARHLRTTLTDDMVYKSGNA
jgi:hypothetical protein